MRVHYEAELLKKFGGFVEGQYYFNNQWFLNAVYAVSKAYGVSRSALAPSRCRWRPLYNGLNGMEWAITVISPRRSSRWQYPVVPSHPGHQVWPAVRVYRGHVLSVLDPRDERGSTAGFNQTNNVNRSNFGDDHRVEFVGFFYF